MKTPNFLAKNAPKFRWGGISSVSDYSAFGVQLENRVFEGQGFRYGFQNQEEDSETGLVNYKYRMHDPRLGRFFAIDPLAGKYPWYAPYQFSGNRLIDMIELEGLEPANYLNNATGDTKVLEFSDYGSEVFMTECIYTQGQIVNCTDVHYTFIDFVQIQNTPTSESSLSTSENSNQEEENIIPSSGSVMDGLENFALKGEFLTKGTNGKYYENGWKGNQYVKTKKYFDDDLLKPISKNAPLVGNLLDAFEVSSAIIDDGGLGKETAIQVSGLVGGAAGAAGFAEIGGIIGSIICPGLGTVIGAAVFAGIGSWLGEEAAEYGSEKIIESIETPNIINE